jgi:hypothetical protein
MQSIKARLTGFTVALYGAVFFLSAVAVGG